MSDLATTRTGHPDTSTIFVLGLLGLLGCLPLGLCAWYFGNRLLRKYDAEPGRWGRRGWAEAGRLMGIIGVGILAVEVLFWLIFVL